jgi:16S rRNA (cytidine1402-2'-O)-methyltransferase
MNKGKLTIIAAPIDNKSALSKEAFELLKSLDPTKDIVLVEDEKPCRRRWLHWGLDREWIEHFRMFNEHTHIGECQLVINDLHNGKNIYLMSDCGLPAFCDPGLDLINLCHDKNITVTSTPFGNSVILAVALSGFKNHQFWFEGFIPTKSPMREERIEHLLKNNSLSVIMDTPYRLKKLISELTSAETRYGISRRYFLAMDLNKETEQLVRGKIGKLKAQACEKKEFILLIEGKFSKS